MTAQDALRDAVPRLMAAGVVDAGRDARLLLAFAMGLPSERLILHLSDVVDAATAGRFDKAIAARINRQPVSQITGQRLFWGRSFEVTPAVLDPRPETEFLVAAALKRPFKTILDLGTGSGCILLSCLADQPGAYGTGVDASPDALEVARNNAARLGLTDRSQFHLSDWCGSVRGQFDLILSNPPYITAAEMANLSPEVHDWEPHLALTPGGDGLAAYRTIAAQAPGHLVSGGRLMAEIGPTQGADVARLFAAQGLAEVTIMPDFDGRNRLVLAVKPW